MSLLAPKDTLAYQLGGRPMFIKRVLSDVPASEVAKSLKVFMSSAHEVMPEREALAFYMLNHAVAEVRARVDMNAPLGKYLPILERYNKLAYASTRMFYYILIICVRETRHLHNAETWKQNIVPLYGQAAANWVASIPDDASSAMKIFYGNPPAATVGQCVDAMHYAFKKGKWSGGFGGKAWADVNDAICKFTHGEFSAEMMMDIAFTLCHNGGPIFNKGMLYTHYNNAELLKILDVQRAGQIPQLIVSGQVSPHYLDHELISDYKMCVDILGDCFTGPVDWKQVMALGAKGNYSKFVTGSAPAAAKGFAPKVKSPIKSPMGKKKEGVFSVMPGVEVPIIKHKRAA
jgi:hypothetical protein